MKLEEQKLCEAVDEFATKMKERLCRKAQAGYEGWDSDYPAVSLQREIADKALWIEREELPDSKWFVDTANRLMMLDFRLKYSHPLTTLRKKERTNNEQSGKGQDIGVGTITHMEVQKMEVNKTQWTQETVDQCNETGGTDFLTTFDSCCQPEFGIKIGWNEPKRLWRPFVVIRFWHYHIQIGWLF